jgi:hypothetical protein
MFTAKEDALDLGRELGGRIRVHREFPSGHRSARTKVLARFLPTSLLGCRAALLEETVLQVPLFKSYTRNN